MSESENLTIPMNGQTIVVGIIFAILVIVGGINTGQFLGNRLFPEPTLDEIPVSAVPGPPRTADLAFTLTPENSLMMQPRNDDELERWADLAGNFYSAQFVDTFSYEAVDEAFGPWVRIKVEPTGRTLRGRLEAKGLKPNFAYQIKLRGDYDRDPIGFGNIGGLGRWRLPGKETNYTDEDFLNYPNKGDVTAYLLFDFFITDENGDAVREFELNHSLHVLWNAARQRGKDLTPDQMVSVMIPADNPDLYLRPKQEATEELIWAERERNRYEQPGELNYLPAHRYLAELVLTEESFHSSARDGGWWATVYRVPIEFTIDHGSL